MTDTDCAQIDPVTLTDCFVTAYRGATEPGGHAVLVAALVMVVDHDTQQRRFGYGFTSSPCLAIRDYGGLADELKAVIDQWAREKNQKMAAKSRT